MSFFWVGHFEFFLFKKKKKSFCFIPIKISPNLYGRMAGSKFWCFPWFPENSLLCVILCYTVYIKDGTIFGSTLSFGLFKKGDGCLASYCRKSNLFKQSCQARVASFVRGLRNTTAFKSTLIMIPFCLEKISN